MHLKLILFLWLITSIAQAAIQGKTVEYRAGETPLKGFLAYDDTIQGQRPGVLVVHEWWGHNEYARNRSKMLAELGYTAFAVDMYGQGKNTEHPKEAGQFAQQLRDNMALAQSR
ncbi:MAG: dienelactone hydrolase family protein, partial [Pseudomonadota bacterium]|nr:dienelactone hydrolase family protein [Pseudomonadota bacterium]